MMSPWENIINTAMLGTDKPGAGSTDFPGELMPLADQIEASELLDRESKFLQKAAIVYNYRQCGFVPLQKQDLPVNSAAAEIKHYCAGASKAALKAILEEDNLSLLKLWLMLCNNNEQLLPPEALPIVLDNAFQHPSLQSFVVACSGNRGEWLSQFNPQWNYFKQLPDEEVWQTGKPEERVKLLQSIRKTNPGMAREWLQQTWEQETATSKAELLKVLRLNSSQDDLPWLESLLTEKGQKVRDEVLTLLKQIPGSSLIQQYGAILNEAVTLKKEKALLGMMKKTSVILQLPDKIDESIFKSGIEKLSGPKSSMSDNDYIIYQLTSFVPSAFWEKQFEATPPQVVEYFEKYAASMLPALALAVSRFKENQWVPNFLHHDGFYADLVNMMPAHEQEKYLLRFIDTDTQNVVLHALHCNHEWGLKFATLAITYMAKNPYPYNRVFFSQNMKLIPVGILNQVEKIKAKEINMQAAWEKTRAHLIKLLTLKQQTLQAFNT